jgi:hypothetical protein
MKYESLSDAAQATGDSRYGSGTTEVWYYSRDEGSRPPDCTDGYEFAQKKGSLPDPANLAATHVRIGVVDEGDLENVYHMMQGNVWSPKGQAWDLIVASRTGHTSMSVGDVVVVNSKAFLVDRFGFAEL